MRSGNTAFFACLHLLHLLLPGVMSAHFRHRLRIPKPMEVGCPDYCLECLSCCGCNKNQTGCKTELDNREETPCVQLCSKCHGCTVEANPKFPMGPPVCPYNGNCCPKEHFIAYALPSHMNPVTSDIKDLVRESAMNASNETVTEETVTAVNATEAG
eukprot:gnl/MRDRNA2_/MRDRNA2_27339_c0_seq1.p1 gnl/MRDRNA2_/MRDRNA2_27339_c0~~gnl/MRDRNA2_/MRDRNA2_27339_c0_seq1.p1  ORF type:complete len:157 (+),score=14.00 gnl/MRDRNA2_/MRDRNA2_27339_c0_seq1:86-556(+)